MKSSCETILPFRTPEGIVSIATLWLHPPPISHRDRIPESLRGDSGVVLFCNRNLPLPHLEYLTTTTPSWNLSIPITTPDGIGYEWKEVVFYYYCRRFFLSS
ncbi:hypothetical protein TNIN_163141 [Trichonephila inaurata madagascariensis]|uniref:Uncharacterized protein n=1 Tax=Trichonephila inaurata madagascariensis TaxID=2747483 RepID=A0A8X6IC77_9ARAC|nr:hypothetical protein TNIN_163141 [Trichonephila inaurata madagascariensis]